MKKYALTLALILLMTFAVVSLASAEDKMEKDKACSLMGTCGNDMVQQARTMLEECNKMMAKAEELKEKGKTIRGQGKLWGDKVMEDDGMKIYDQGVKMYEEAKKLGDTCKLIIEEGDKLKNKYGPSGSTPKPMPEPPLKGDKQ